MKIRVKALVSTGDESPNIIPVMRGSLYNVVEVVKDGDYMEFNNQMSDVWYKLLETGETLHNSLIFIEVNENDEVLTETDYGNIEDIS